MSRLLSGFAATVFAGLVSGLLPVSLHAQPLAVEVVNRSEPVLCAEKDNVALMFSNPSVKQLRIQAAHPAYIGTITVDSDAPDFTSCDMSSDPVFAADNPGQVSIYQSSDLWITGFTFPSFWRPATVPVRVAANGSITTFEGLHMLQVWVREQADRPEEVLVLYPPDGYWRARPLSFGQMRWTAYGSSFLVGPVQDVGRPAVVLESVTFIPQNRAFELKFASGGSAIMQMVALDRNHIALDIEFEGIDTKLPFAALRSMYVTRTNADVSEVAWREPAAAGWLEAPIMSFKDARVSELWAGRSVPSRHNLSAPDMLFGPFKAR